MNKKSRIRDGVDAVKFGYPFWIGVALWLVAVVMIVFAGKTLYESNAFTIKEVRSNVVLSPELVNTLKGRSLFSLNISSLYKRIVAVDSDLKDVVITKKFPSVLEIILIKRKPFVQIKYNGFFTVDKDAIIIDSDPAPVPNLLAIEISDCPKNPAKGVKVMTAQFKLALTLIDALRAHNVFARYSVELINVASENSAYFMMRNKNTVLVPVQVIIGDEDFDRRLFIFDNLMATKIKNDLHMVKYIDLRYKKAYVGYKN